MCVSGERTVWIHRLIYLLPLEGIYYNTDNLYQHPSPRNYWTCAYQHLHTSRVYPSGRWGMNFLSSQAWYGINHGCSNTDHRPSSWSSLLWLIWIPLGAPSAVCFSLSSKLAYSLQVREEWITSPAFIASVHQSISMGRLLPSAPWLVPTASTSHQSRLWLVRDSFLYSSVLFALVATYYASKIGEYRFHVKWVGSNTSIDRRLLTSFNGDSLSILF